jgi:signal transduction histidine kinase
VDQAALAVENERLQAALRARLEEERALRRVATLIAQEHEPEMVLTVVAEEVARHLGADAAMTARYDGPDRATVLADWSAPGVAAFPVGEQIELGPETAMARVYATHAPARVDSYEGMEGEYPEHLRSIGMRAAVAAPILVDGRLWGAVAAGSTAERFDAEAETRLGAFAELVAQAIANVDARIELKRSRARIVEAADEARRRIERDLHDGAQARLVCLALSLRLAAGQAEPATATAIEDCLAELRAAMAELRELARGLHPVVLTERGLGAALEMLAARSPVPVALRAELDERLPVAVETALYFVAAEALTNVAKYAQASSASVTLRHDDGWAEIEIADDGTGGARPEDGTGLHGLRDRVDALGGDLAVSSDPGAGTTIRARVPL